MYIFLIGAISFLMLINAIGISDARSKVDYTDAHQAAVLQIDKYRSFLFVADQYMKSGPAAVSAPTSVSWALLKEHPLAPPGSRALNMPYNWKIVRSPDNSWVACTELDERSITALWQLNPPTTDSGMTYIASSGRQPASYVVIGDETKATRNAVLCQ